MNVKVFERGELLKRLEDDEGLMLRHDTGSPGTLPCVSAAADTGGARHTVR